MSNKLEATFGPGQTTPFPITRTEEDLHDSLQLCRPTFAGLRGEYFERPGN